MAVAWSEHVEEIKAAAAVLVASGVIWRGVLVPVLRFARKVELMLKELTPNGGSSLRDAIDRVEKRLDAVEMHLTQPKGH